MNKNVIFLILFLTVSGQGYSQTDSSKSFPDAKSILEKWESSYSGIKTMRVSCFEKLLWYKESEKKPEGILDDLDISKVIKQKYIECVEQGKLYHIRYSTSEDGFAKPENLTEYAFNGAITQEYFGSAKYGTIRRGQGKSSNSNNPLKEYMQLTRYYFDESKPDGIPRFVWALRNAIDTNNISMRTNLETIADQLCHVIEIQDDFSPRSKQIFWLAYEKGMCLMKSQHSTDDGLFIEMEVQEIASVTGQNGNLIYYPTKAIRYVKDELGETKYELTVNEFVPDIAIDENSFKIAFPPGTEISDHVLGMSFKSDGTFLSRSLINKSVTELKIYGIDLPLSDIQEKMLLICFFDIEQRPSRNYITELNKKILWLSEKGIEVVALHASTSEQSEIDDWVKENDISLPVGMINGDWEKIRAEWGIEALPWMILTDKEQIVIAEGFSLSELYKKVKDNK